MRRGLTLPTRQLNASHDAEILLHEKHKLISSLFGTSCNRFVVSFIQFLYHNSVSFTFFAEKIYHSISQSILSRKVMMRHLFFAPLSLHLLFVILVSVLSISEHLGPSSGEQEKRRGERGEE